MRTATDRAIGALALLAILAANPVIAQEPDEETPFDEELPPEEGEFFDEPFEPPRRFVLRSDLKAGLRWSKAEEGRLFFPFPPSFLPPGRDEVVMETPDPGTSLETQYLALEAEGDIASNISGKIEIRFLDLYNRNPTSSDDRVVLRQAWVRFGRKAEPVSGDDESTLYVQFGRAPRFTKQMVRRLESYGLWGTAVGRFEQVQLETGLRLGDHVYARGMLGTGNPVFIRDTNALAGDNGTPERQPDAVDPIYGSGFPILYDAKPSDVDFDGDLEWGAGLGLRFGGEEDGLDLLGWYFTRRMEERVRIRGTSYSGDLRLLDGVAFPLPYEGDRKREWGVNLHARLGDLRLFGQYVDQSIAGLPRRGVEVEAAWVLDFPALFLIGESPFGNWVQPAFRFSWIDNRFEGPREYPALSALWDWKKYDFGLRFGLVRDVDLTAEYTLHQVDRGPAPNLPMDELLVTLRASFDLF